MELLTEFLRQKAPKSGKDMPAYYLQALIITTVLLLVYFVVGFLIFGLLCKRWEFVPLVAAAAAGILRMNLKRMTPRAAGLTVSTIVGGWCLWFVHNFGWSSGVQQLLVASMILSFFNVSERAPLKILFCFSIVAVRTALFIYASHHAELYPLDGQARMVFQVYNSLLIYSILASQCALFSTSVQAAERQLRIDNQELHREAGTDPLTQLPNRRAMMDDIHEYLKKYPEQPFGVAIADIDFFKRVNDTYGHNCGDYTLRTLSDKFREFCDERIRVCRWGGEEFCFFMPEMNLDEAGAAMNDLCYEVRQMPLSFEDASFSITITIGVSENDFRSPMEEILNEADRKLYMGKESGRDRVVI